jgi:hypothetical protein
MKWMDLSKVSLSKVAYNIWVESGCTGTYILDDKAVDGTSGYGETAGIYRIVYDQTKVLIPRPVAEEVIWKM